MTPIPSRCIQWLLLFLAASFVSGALGAVNVLTYHYDNARTGQNTNETVLTPAIVGSTNFGKIFEYTVDGCVYAQPLLVTNVNIPGKGVHNVVYVATQHDSVYAFDADSGAGSNSVPLWQTNFINPAAGVSTVSSNEVECNELSQEIGIMSTPVIDLSTGTIYVQAETSEVIGGPTYFIHRLHALDLATGAEKFGGPVIVAPSVPGTGDGNNGAGQVPFNGLTQLNRSALLLDGGVVYIGCGSTCDFPPYHGWLIGYDSTTLALSNVFNTTPNGAEGGIWMAGDGPATDGNGNIYVMTGNGSYDTNASVLNFGDSFLKLAAGNGLSVADYFTPCNESNLYLLNMDLGSGGVVLLPDEAGNSAIQHLMVGAGKEGTIYLVNRDNMGHFNSANNDQIVQCLTNAITRSWSTPAYFCNTLYYAGVGDTLKAFSLSNACISPSASGQSPTRFGYPGATPSVSANGTEDAIVWVLQTDAFAHGGPAILHAYNATNVALELYNSTNAESGLRDNPGAALKFTVPTVANGRVYVGAAYKLAVFGVSNFLSAPQISPGGGNFTNSILVAITEAVPDASIYYTLDNTPPTTNSTLYTGPFLLTNSVAIRARAFKADYVDSITSMVTFYQNTLVGAGTGLTGTYYSGQYATFTNPPSLTRIDSAVDFDWGASSPAPDITGGRFTVMWTGLIAPQFSETYTFYTTASDGVRLWVNGQLIVNAWMNQTATEWSGSIALQSGQLYPITVEYYEITGNAAAHLAWSSATTAKAMVPESQLYSDYHANLILHGDSPANGVQVEVSGLTGKGYTLEVSTNLAAWYDLQTILPDPNPNDSLPTNLFYFTDTNGISCQRFYRTRQEP